jgi:hypothetical protein
MPDQDTNGRDPGQDVERLVLLEIALRNIAAPWASGFDVVERLSGQVRHRLLAAPVLYGMRHCDLRDLLSAVIALRHSLEGEKP